MKKTLLNFIWQYGRFDHHNLCTQTGERIEIIHSGIPNKGHGPDFIGSTIRIGQDLWKGAIVIHIDGQDWYEMEQNSNLEFSNVILHVSFRNVLPIYNEGGHKIPTLELNGKISTDLIADFDEVQGASSVLACKDHVINQATSTYDALRDKLVIERLESKSQEIYQTLDADNWNWDVSFIKLLIRNFGGGPISVNFDQLSEILDYSLLFENRDSVFTVEALLFGQAGMLDREFKDGYPSMLKDAYSDMNEVYDLQSINSENWEGECCQFRDLAPLRIAQLAQIICGTSSVFNYFLDHKDPKLLLESLNHSFYWDDHIDFDKPRTVSVKLNDNRFVENILIQVIIPSLYSYGKSMDVPDVCLHATELLNELEPEVNRKTDLFSSIGIQCRNAADSQAINYVISKYCVNKKCLDCPVGCHLFGTHIHKEEEDRIAEFDYIYN